MLSLTVQTLDGHILDVVVDPAGCVKDIRKYLAEQYALSNCALYLQARQLSMKTSIADLELQDGAQLTALTTLGSAVAAPQGRQRYQQQQQQPLSPAGLPSTNSETAAAGQQQQQQLDTLLPGYASRPFPSPVKVSQQRQRIPSASAAAGAVGEGGGAAQLQPARQQQQELAAPAAVALHQPADPQSSHLDFAVQASSGQNHNEAAAEAAGLSNGGFILSGDSPSQQQQREGLCLQEGSSYAGAGSSNSSGWLAKLQGSRKKDGGRTLLQQHMMMQHDLRQQELLAAQQQQQQVDQQRSVEQQQQLATQKRQLAEEQQQHEQQQQEAELQPGQQGCESAAQLNGVQGSLQQDIQDQQQQADPQQQQVDLQACLPGAEAALPHQQQQQHGQDPNPQQQQQQQSLSVSYKAWLDQPSALPRAQQNVLLDLSLPVCVDQLLLLHGRLDVCYTFLLQQRIQPQWDRLAAMMKQLFPQGPAVTLHHLILMSQLTPQAVLLLLPPPRQQQQQLGEQIITIGDEILWTATLTDREINQLQSQLQHSDDNIDHSSSAADDALHTNDDVVQPSRKTLESPNPASVAVAGRVSTAAGPDPVSISASICLLQEPPAAAAAALAEGLIMSVKDVIVVLVDPGPQGGKGKSGRKTSSNKKRRKTAAATAAEDDDSHDSCDQEALSDAAAGTPAATDSLAEGLETVATAAAAAAGTGGRQRSRPQLGLGITSSSDQLQPSQTLTLSARHGSGSKVASARRQRHMRLCVTAAVAMLHTQQMAQQQPQQQGEAAQQNVTTLDADLTVQAGAGACGKDSTAVTSIQCDTGQVGQLLLGSNDRLVRAGAVEPVPADDSFRAALPAAAAATNRKRKLFAASSGQQQQQGVQEQPAGVAAVAEPISRPGLRRSQRHTAAQQQQQGTDTDGTAAAVPADLATHPRAAGQRKRCKSAARTSQGSNAAAAAAGERANNSQAANTSAWDPLKHHSWHPDFAVTTIQLQDLLQAVSQHQSWLQCQQRQQPPPGATGPSASVRGMSSTPGGIVMARPTRTLARNKTCTSCEGLNPEQLLDHLKSLTWYQDQVVHIQNTSAREPRYCPTTQPMAPSTLAALASRDIHQLFIHQSSAVDALMCKHKHVVIATSTASGKSLCYNIPMLEALAQDPHACGVLMFPTKALAQDQLRVLRQLMNDAFGQQAPCVEVYDGDTPQIDRPDIRDRAQLLITNPDMLHQSILPCHKNFTRLFSKLAYVVVDEGHAYRGVFGCHTALVLRRLRRICDRCYGSQPKFVVTSATIANPLEHASLLLGVSSDDLLLVDEDGSPHGPKQFVMWNPPLTWEAQQAMSADAAGGVSGSGGVLSRTEMRGGSYKLHREMARTLTRESNAARRRGIALSAAAGVTEEEWTAAVKLGATGSAAKAFLFGHPSHSPSIAVAATAAAGAHTTPHGRYIHLNQQQQQQQQDSDDGARVQHLASAASVAADDHVEQSILSVETRQVARDALAAVAAASMQQSGGRRQQQQLQGPKPIVRPPSHLAQALNSALPSGPGNSSSSRSSKRQRGAVTAEVQREIEEALPVRGSFKEKYGAAGTPLDQRRESPIVEMSLLLTEAVMHGLRTIAFCKSRKLCELIAAYTRENLKAAAPHKANMVKVYRGGYSPAERRQLESDLHSGALTAVAATNALELGIDVGHLDITLHLGFPGSVASLWQQAGRAGRRKQSSLSVYVGFDGPLDQHFMKHPQELFQRPIECVRLDPCNALVLNSHLICAAKELALLEDLDGPLFGPSQLTAAMQSLSAASILGRHPHDPLSLNAMHYVGRCSNPAADVSLRTIDPERFIIYNTADNSVLEEIESNMAFYEIYDGAIYLFQGHTFICTSLNMETRVAYVKPVGVRWYTKVRDHTDIHVTGGHVAYPTAHAALAAIAARRVLTGQEGHTPAIGRAHQLCHGPQQGIKQEGAVDIKPAVPVISPLSHVKQEEVKAEHTDMPAESTAAVAGLETEVVDVSVTELAAGVGPAVCESCVITVRFMGYFRVHQGSGKVFDAIDLFLPDTQFETQATYLRLPPSARRACQAANIPFREAVHAASHAILNVLPLYMVCNSTDMGTECDNPYDTRFRPERLLLYDKHPGGIGLAAQATPLFPELIQRALDLIENCSCPYLKGCPCCVQHLDCKNYNVVLHKGGGILILKAVLGLETEPAEPGTETGHETRPEAAELST